MSLDVNHDVEEEVVAPTQEDESMQEPKTPAYGSKEYNIQEMRRLLEQQSREIKELKAHAQQVETPQPDDDEENQDNFLTRREAQELIKRQEAATLEDRTRLKFKDYDDVVTVETVKKLIEDDADLADSISGSKNPYATAYKLIKKSAFFNENTKEKPKSQEAEKIIKNAQKPISANAVQSRPLSQASSFMSMSEQEKLSVYREMMEYANRR